MAKIDGKIFKRVMEFYELDTEDYELYSIFMDHFVIKHKITGKKLSLRH